jgi:hypothetical protein
MRQDVDRSVGEELDVVAAMSQRTLDIAGIEHVEKIQYALAAQSLGHSCSGFGLLFLIPTRWCPDSKVRIVSRHLALRTLESKTPANIIIQCGFGSEVRTTIPRRY